MQSVLPNPLEELFNFITLTLRNRLNSLKDDKKTALNYICFCYDLIQFLITKCSHLLGKECLFSYLRTWMSSPHYEKTLGYKQSEVNNIMYTCQNHLSLSLLSCVAPFHPTLFQLSPWVSLLFIINLITLNLLLSL
jgi:hypothetical protein